MSGQAMEKDQGHSHRAHQRGGGGTAGITAPVSNNITAQMSSVREETWAGHAGKACNPPWHCSSSNTSCAPWVREKGVPQRHAGLMMQWAGSWGLWELLGAGPALVWMVLPLLHTKRPLCSQAGAETGWLLASSSGPKPHGDGATACKHLCPGFLSLGPIRVGKERRKVGSPFLSHSSCTSEVAMVGLWSSMLHTYLAVFPITRLITLQCSLPACYDLRHPTTLPNTLACSLPFCHAPYLRVHLLLPVLGHHGTIPSAPGCWGSGAGCPLSVQVPGRRRRAVRVAGGSWLQRGWCCSRDGGLCPGGCRSGVPGIAPEVQVGDTGVKYREPGGFDRVCKGVQ